MKAVRAKEVKVLPWPEDLNSVFGIHIKQERKDSRLLPDIPHLCAHRHIYTYTQIIKVYA